MSSKNPGSFHLFSSHWPKMTVEVPEITCIHIQRQKNAVESPPWCGSVSWASSCKPKVHQLDSCQGTCLGCGPGPWLGACNQCFSPPLSPPPSSLSKNKQKENIKKKEKCSTDPFIAFYEWRHHVPETPCGSLDLIRRKIPPDVPTSIA